MDLTALGELKMEIILCAGAWVFHYLEKWADYRQREAAVGLKAFTVRYPAKNLMSLIGAVLAFIGCYEIQWMNPGMALACGYMGDSITRRIVDRFGSGSGGPA